MRRLALAIAAIGGVLVLTASSCEDKGEGRGDAGIGRVHEAPRQIWEMPDSWSNVAATCIGPNGVYENRKDKMIVKVNDPNCEEGGVLHE